MAEPPFRSKAGYRRRRVEDAARLAPFGGGLLWLLPLGWEGAATGNVIVFLFVVWLALVLLGVGFSWLLGRDDPPEEN